MASEPIAVRVRQPGLLATPGYARLWFAGGVGNAMRWLELLVAGIFTYDVTHSAFLVAVVTVARSLPMLFLGPIAGVIAEAVSRKRLLLAQLFGMAAVSAVPSSASPGRASWRCAGACSARWFRPIGSSPRWRSIR